MARAFSIASASVNIASGVLATLVAARLLDHDHFFAALIETVLVGVNAGIAIFCIIRAAEAR